MKFRNIYHSQKLRKYSRRLRQTSTPAEGLLWKSLRGKQLFGFKFRRQVPIDKYIVDFFCEKANLIIEIDGASHDDKKFDYDTVREKELTSKGYRVLRFSEFQVVTRINDVMQSVELSLPTSP